MDFQKSIRTDVQMMFKLFGITIFIWRTPPGKFQRDALQRVANHYHRLAIEATHFGEPQQATLFGNLAAAYESSVKDGRWEK